MQLRTMKIIFELVIYRFSCIFRLCPCVIDIGDKFTIEFKHLASVKKDENMKSNIIYKLFLLIDSITMILFHQ